MIFEMLRRGSQLTTEDTEEFIVWPARFVKSHRR